MHDEAPLVNNAGYMHPLCFDGGLNPGAKISSDCRLGPDHAETLVFGMNLAVATRSPLPRAMLGPPVVPFDPFLGEGSPTKNGLQKEGTLVLSSLLET